MVKTAFLRAPSGPDGRVYETGPYARRKDRELGDDVRGRMTARIRETVALACHVAELASDWRAYDPPEESFRPSSGNGMGWAEAARGRLVHSTQVEGDHVRRYRILAPTDWNFHPQGVMRAALETVRGCSAAEAPGMVRWIVAALDPCVACHVTVRESFHA